MRSVYRFEKPLSATGDDLPTDVYKMRFEIDLKAVTIYRITPAFDAKKIGEKHAKGPAGCKAAELETKKISRVWDKANELDLDEVCALVSVLSLMPSDLR